MKVLPTPIAGVFVVETKPFRDGRGFFYRSFCNHELSSVLQHRTIYQMNVSCTEIRGAIRGLHFQYSPDAEMKLVRCLQGLIWDVALDLRCGSPTFLQWYGIELSSKNTSMMVIPEGCAHGFQVLEERSEVLYLHTAAYNPKSEGGIRYNDSALSIVWPMTVTDISERDSTHPLLSQAFQGISV